MSGTLGFVVSLAEMEQFYRGGKAGQIIELMNKTNDIMDDVLWMESNQSDGHLTRIRTGLPEVYWRRLYQGTPPSKSQWSQVKEGCGILEAIMELDVEELRLYGSRDKSFRMSEGVAFAEAMRQKVAATLFYGDSNLNPDEFNGLSMRYPARDANNVLDAGGRDEAGCTSLWLISWGAQAVHGIYPKGSSGGLSHEDLRTYMAQDPDGRKYQVVGDKYNWRCGLAVRDWRGVVRVGVASAADDVAFILRQPLLNALKRPRLPRGVNRPDRRAVHRARLAAVKDQSRAHEQLVHRVAHVGQPERAQKPRLLFRQMLVSLQKRFFHQSSSPVTARNLS